MGWGLAAAVAALSAGVGGSGWSPETRTTAEMVATAEARARGYFPPTGSAIEPDRLTNVSPEVFARYAREGIPVVVTDAIRDWPMNGWVCTPSLCSPFAPHLGVVR